jgi:hypothetical protein
LRTLEAGGGVGLIHCAAIKQRVWLLAPMKAHGKPTTFAPAVFAVFSANRRV